MGTEREEQEKYMLDTDNKQYILYSEYQELEKERDTLQTLAVKLSKTIDHQAKQLKEIKELTDEQ